MSSDPRRQQERSPKISVNQFWMIPGFFALASSYLRIQFVMKAAPDDRYIMIWAPVLAALLFVVGWYLAIAFEHADRKTRKAQVRWLPLVVGFVLVAIGMLVGDVKVFEAAHTSIYTLAGGYFFRLSAMKDAAQSSSPGGFTG